MNAVSGPGSAERHDDGTLEIEFDRNHRDAALDVSQKPTAICVDDDDRRLLAEGKVETWPVAIAAWLGHWTGVLEKGGMEIGLTAKKLPIVCLDARHASAALKVIPNKTDRHDAPGLAQIVCTGGFKAVRIKIHGAHVGRALDAEVRSAARRDRTARLFMSAPGVGPITALAVASASRRCLVRGPIHSGALPSSERPRPLPGRKRSYIFVRGARQGRPVAEREAMIDRDHAPGAADMRSKALAPTPHVSFYRFG